MSKQKKLAGAEAFELYYGELFADRWPSLRAALLEPVKHFAWEEKLLKPYYLDAGSVSAALALPKPDSSKVLDMCAAPGGKSLVLAGLLDEGSTLTSNEFSRDRKNRLVSVLDQHLPPPLRARVSVTGYDASRWSRYEKGAYDRILLDAPCSSERHVLSSPSYLAEWSPARVKSLALRQWALLSGAWLVLAPGGALVYSTCALSPKENDEVVERLLDKYSDAKVCGIEFDERFRGMLPKAEKTRFGWHVLPDTSDGAGPLYYALVRKESF